MKTSSSDKDTTTMQLSTSKLLLPTLLAAVCVVPQSVAASPRGLDPFRTERAIAKLAPEYAAHANLPCALPNGLLTLEDAINLALCRNPTTRAAWAAAQAQAANLGIAEGAFLPSLTITGNKDREHGELTPGLEATTTIERRSAVASLNWTLVDFGGRRSAVANARSLLAAAAHSGSATAQRTVAEVVQAFHGVAATEQAVVANQQTEANAARSLEIARALQTGGAATLADVMQAETAYHQTVYARIQSMNNAEASRGTLAVLLGFTADQPLKLAPVATPSAAAVTARVSELLALAARQNPELAAARDQQAAAEAAVTTARAVGRPRISLGAQYTLAENAGLPRQKYDSVGLTISIPVFSGLQTHYGIRRAQATLDQATEQAEQSRLAVSQAVWNAYHSLEAANQQLATSATLAKAAATNEEIATGRYQSGVGSILDVLTAQSASANARLIRIQSEFSWQSARAQLAQAVGRLGSADDLDAVAPVEAR
jgi:TolC family type I secretion outer membrane protein